MLMHDFQAWNKYPQHHNWFNKLWLSEKLGYKCGPCGTAPTDSKYYIIRPTYNLSGMGVGAEFVYIEKGDMTKVPPGYFWQEIILGKHYSVTYDVNNQFEPISCYEGISFGNELWRFNKWIRSDYYPEFPDTFKDLNDVDIINIEFKGTSPIEVHLRGSADPQYDEIIPIWKDRKNDIDKYQKMGYTYIDSPDDADGFLKIPRLGFMVK